MTTLEAARDELREQVMAGEAVPCPCCKQLAKVYRRQIHATMARHLILMYRDGGDRDGWFHMPTVLGGHFGDAAKLAYWGLIEGMPNVERADGSTRTGWWRLTAKGEEFVLGVATVPRYAHVYDGRVLKLTGGEVSIHRALGKNFNYRELMAE